MDGEHAASGSRSVPARVQLASEEDEGTLIVPKKAVYAVYGTVFMDMLGTYISNPVLPFYAQEFAATASMVGYLFSAPALAAVVTAKMLGQAADRWGRRPIMLVSLLGAATGSIMQACSESYTDLIGARAFFGIWTNSMAIAQVYLADVATGLERTNCMAQLTSIKQLSMFFGPGMGGVLSKYGLNVPILADGVATLFAAFFVYLFLVESPAWTQQQTQQLMSPAMIANGSVPPRESAPMSWGFKVLLIPTFLNAAVLVNMNMTLAIFAQRAYGFNAFHVGLMYLSACAITIVTTSYMVKPIQRKIGLYPLAVVTCAGQGICLMFMAFSPDKWGFVSFYLISRVFASAKLASAQTVLSNFTVTSNRGRLMGIKTQVENVANIISPPIMGWMTDVELTSPWIFCAAAQVVGAIFTWMVNPARHTLPSEPLLQEPLSDPLSPSKV